MAMELPVAIIEMASEPCRAPATRVAMTEAIDQNMACAQATSRRDSTRTGNDGAAAEQTCPIPNSATTKRSRRLNSMRDAATMSGSDSRATAQA